MIELQNIDHGQKDFGSSLGIPKERANHLVACIAATIGRLERIDWDETKARTFELLALECDTVNEVIFICVGFVEMVFKQRRSSPPSSHVKVIQLDGKIDRSSIPEFLRKIKEAAEAATTKEVSGPKKKTRKKK